jgi:hypothetical protein
MIAEQMYLMNYTKTLSVDSLQQAHADTYLVATGTTIGWSTRLGMPLLCQCFWHFLPMANTLACLLPFPDLHNLSTQVPFDMGCWPL